VTGKGVRSESGILWLEEFCLTLLAAGRILDSGEWQFQEFGEAVHEPALQPSGLFAHQIQAENAEARITRSAEQTVQQLDRLLTRPTGIEYQVQHGIHVVGPKPQHGRGLRPTRWA
jgi:hypothetical protein